MPEKPTYEELEQRVRELERDDYDRKHAEEKLQKSESRFRLMFMNAPLPYQSLDEYGNFLDVNEPFLEVMGYTREEVIGRNFGEFLHPDWMDHFKENFPRFKAVGEVLGVEFEMVKKDGSTIFVSFNGKIQHDDQGRFRCTHCIFNDITAHKQSEAALREREDFLSTILNTTADGFWVIDPEGVFIDVNEAYCSLSGYTREEILGLHINDIDADEVPAQTRERIYRIIANKSEVFETRHRRKDGSIFPVEIAATFINPHDQGPSSGHPRG